VNISSGCQWTTTGTGTFAPDDSSLVATYFPSAGDLTAGTFTIRLTTTGNGICTSASDSMVVTIIQPVIASAGNDTSVCANSGNIQLNGSSIGSGSIQWTTNGSGTFI